MQKNRGDKRKFLGCASLPALTCPPKESYKCRHDPEKCPRLSLGIDSPQRTPSTCIEKSILPQALVTSTSCLCVWHGPGTVKSHMCVSSLHAFHNDS